MEYLIDQHSTDIRIMLLYSIVKFVSPFYPVFVFNSTCTSNKLEQGI